MRHNFVPKISSELDHLELMLMFIAALLLHSLD